MSVTIGLSSTDGRLLTDRSWNPGAEPLIPLRFDSEERRPFGVYHPALVQSAPRRGDDELVDLDGWLEDVCTSHHELLSQAAASEVTWLGARLDGAVVIRGARSVAASLRRLVLWGDGGTDRAPEGLQCPDAMPTSDSPAGSTRECPAS